MDIVKEITYLRFADITIAKCTHGTKPNSLEQSYGAWTFNNICEYAYCIVDQLHQT